MRKIDVCIITFCVIGVITLLISIEPISNAVSEGLDVLITKPFVESLSN